MCHPACSRPPAQTWEKLLGWRPGWAHRACQLACTAERAGSWAQLQAGTLRMGKVQMGRVQQHFEQLHRARMEGQGGPAAGTCAWEHAQEVCCCHMGAAFLPGAASVTAARDKTPISTDQSSGHLCDADRLSGILRSVHHYVQGGQTTGARPRTSQHTANCCCMTRPPLEHGTF